MCFLSSIDDIFTEAFQSFTSHFSWASVIILLSGIMIGFIIAGCVYLIIFFTGIKKEKKHQFQDEEVIHDEDLRNKLNIIKEDFFKTTEGLTIKQKSNMLGSTIFNVTNTVATAYFPDSKYPLYELSVDEIIVLLGYISKRLDHLFDKAIFRFFRKFTVAQVFELVDSKKKLQETKLAKAAEKVQPNKFVKVISTALNYANPIYWFRRTVLNTTVNFTVNKLFGLVIDIVSNETDKAYSKSFYNEERNLMDEQISMQIKEVEEAMSKQEEKDGK